MRYTILVFFIAFAMPLTALSISPAIADDSKIVETLLNDIRAKNDRRALRESEQLTAAAVAHAQDMNRKGYFSHTGLDGSDHFERIKRQGYKACYTAENIAKGQKTPAKVMADWMRSEGHRHNILNDKPVDYGLGISGNVWVMLFAKGC